MQASQSIHELQPRVFDYSLDWRFLLPIGDPQNIHVLVEGNRELSEALIQVGIPTANQYSSSDIKQIAGTQSLVLPFGLPVRSVGPKHEDQVEFLRSIRRLMQEGGYLLIGFNNSWNHSSKPGAYHLSTPRRAADQLTQAGFKSITICGAIPNLDIPEYIFALDPRAIHFALRHRLRRKVMLRNGLEMISRTIGLAAISGFLPCYFAIAVA